MPLELERIAFNDLQLGNRWRLDIGVLPGGLGLGIVPGNISFLAKSTNLPTSKLVVETHASGAKFYDGYEEVDSITMDFWETSNHRVRDYFNIWKESIFDSVEKKFKIVTNIPKFRQGTLTFFASQDAQGFFPLKTYQLVDMLIQSVAEQSLDQENGDAMITSVTCSLQRVSTLT